MINEKLYETLLNGITDGVYFVDKSRKITFWNDAAEEITGFNQTEMINQFCYDNHLNHIDENGKHLCYDGCPLHQTMEDGVIREANLYLHHKDGYRVPITAQIIPIFEGNKIVGAVETFNDNPFKSCLTNFNNHQQNADFFDELTSLPNNKYLKNFYEEEVIKSRLLNESFGVVIFDIDSFDKIKNENSNQIIDELIVMISNVFKALTRQDDIIAVLNDSKFVGIFSNVNLLQLQQTCDRIIMLVENSALRKENITLGCTISIGAVLYNEGESLEQIVKRAEENLYIAKNTGSNKAITSL